MTWSYWGFDCALERLSMDIRLLENWLCRTMELWMGFLRFWYVEDVIRCEAVLERTSLTEFGLLLILAQGL